MAHYIDDPINLCYFRAADRWRRSTPGGFVMLRDINTGLRDGGCKLLVNTTGSTGLELAASKIRLAFEFTFKFRVRPVQTVLVACLL